MRMPVLWMAFVAIAVITAFYLIWPQIALWRRRVKEPSCPRCGYPTRGIAGLRCPECGVNLTEEGIITPEMAFRRKRTVLTVLAAWTFFWALGGWLAVVVAQWTTPAILQATKVQSFTLTGDSLTGDLTLVSTFVGKGRQLNQRARVELSRGGSSVCTIEFDAVSGRVERITGIDPSISVFEIGEPLSARLLGSALSAAAVKDSASHATDMFALLDSVIAQPPSNAGGLSSIGAWNPTTARVSSRVATPWWILAVSAAVWLGLWGLVALALARRERRRQGNQAGGVVHAATIGL